MSQKGAATLNFCGDVVKGEERSRARLGEPGEDDSISIQHFLIGIYPILLPNESDKSERRGSSKRQINRRCVGMAQEHAYPDWYLYRKRIARDTARN